MQIVMGGEGSMLALYIKLLTFWLTDWAAGAGVEVEPGCNPPAVPVVLSSKQRKVP